MGFKIDSGFRKNFSLIATFIVLISALLVLSLVLAFNISKKKIEGDFVSAKTNVLEATMKPYNDFFLNKLPEISYYNGYLDSTTAGNFVDSILLKYPFISKVMFYDAEVRNMRFEESGLNVGDFSIGMKNVYQFGKNIAKDSIKVFGNNALPNSVKLENFSELALKLYTFVHKLDTNKMPTQEELFNNFSTIKANRIDYFNIPRFEDLKIYKRMIREKLPSEPVYQQDMLSFDLDPFRLNIANNRPLLYQSVRIEPVTYDPIETSSQYVTGEMNLGGAFSAYKLYFISSKSFVKKEIFNYFFPVATVIFLIYFLLLLVAYLIFRNLNVSQKMFKLQYDFLTNLTHEFKTPVAVIKIAGNNIKSAASLTEREQKMYGKILDEEADKLNGLMNKLLAFTQIENKAIKLNEDQVNIVEFIESTIDSYQLKYPDFKLSYEVQGFKQFITDPVLLGSLFDNLFENAYKYSPVNNKELHVTAKLVKDKVVLRFVDKGIGIQAAELENIFKKFYRIQNQYNQSGSVGLGLAFCKELVNFMKGEIFVESTVNEGTEFKVILPYNN